MDATELSDKIRELIDRETLAANLDDEEACIMAIDALDEAGDGYAMLLSELSDE